MSDGPDVWQEWWKAVLGAVAAVAALIAKVLWGNADKIVSAIQAMQQAVVDAIVKEGKTTRTALHLRIDRIEGKLDSMAVEDAERETRFVKQMGEDR